MIVYYLLFTDGTNRCTPSRVACRLDNNAGAVDTFAVAVALLAVVATGVLRRIDHHSLARRFEYLLDQTVYECVHNLRHIADAFDGDALRSSPLYTTRVMSDLVAEPIRAYLLQDARGQRLWNHVDHILRNDDLLRRLPLHLPPPRGEAAPVEAVRTWAVATNPTKYLVEHQLRFIADAVSDYPELDLHCVLSKSVAKDDPHCFPLRQFAEVLVNARVTEFYVRFHATWIERDRKEEHARFGRPVKLTTVCWDDDLSHRDTSRVDATVGERFGALGDPPLPAPARSPTP